MGLGWHIQTRNEKRILWHRGETLGQTSFVGIVPNESKAVVMLSNSAFGSCCCDLAVWQCDPAVLPKEQQNREIRETPSDSLEQFEGVYAFGPDISMRLTSEQGHLSVEVDGAKGGKMYPIDDTEFITKDGRVKFNFFKSKNEVRGFRLMQHGIEQLVFKRPDA